MNGRLLIDEPAPGAWNMSVDAAILAGFRAGDRPTLRFYRWSQPTLSLGYFQSIEDRFLHPESQNLDLVRRATGGGAIIHDRELTYSLTVPNETRNVGGSDNLYRDVHECIIAVLSELGIVVNRFGRATEKTVATEPFLCFQRRTEHDLILRGYKVCGSAQRRSREGLLQHGSLLLLSGPASPQLPGILELSGGASGREPFPPHNVNQRDPFGPWWDCALRNISQKIATEIGDLLSVEWSVETLNQEEVNAANGLHRERFGCQTWNARR